MKRILVLMCTVLTSTALAGAQKSPRVVESVVDIRTSDGVVLKGTYFSAARPGPGVLLLHQVNRDRKSWEGVAAQLAAAGINTLALDMRGHGESGGTPVAKMSRKEAGEHWRGWPADAEAGLQFLISQPGVNRETIGFGGAGLLGVDNSVEVARRYPSQVKSLVLISGETFRDGLQFLHQASQLPGLFVVADEDEYPPTAEAMQLLYVTSSCPGKKLIHYSAGKDAPWLWYEPVDIGRVPATGTHGTDLFSRHPELPGMIVDWFVTTLIRTPGHAPADALAAGEILNLLQTPGGAEKVREQLTEARRRDPGMQLFPEISASIVGFDYMRVGDPKSAVQVLQLVQMAYPESADANEDLAEAYSQDGQQERARQYAEKTLSLLDAHAPASSWADSEQIRGEVRRAAQKLLDKTAAH